MTLVKIFVLQEDYERIVNGETPSKYWLFNPAIPNKVIIELQATAGEISRWRIPPTQSSLLKG